MIGQAVTLAGAVLILLSAIGVARFPNALARMHALTKASTLGVVLVAVGAAFVLPTANDITSALAAALLQILTLPISASLIARATYLAGGIPNRVDAIDELAETLSAVGAAAGRSPADTVIWAWIPPSCVGVTPDWAPARPGTSAGPRTRR